MNIYVMIMIWMGKWGIAEERICSLWILIGSKGWITVNKTIIIIILLWYQPSHEQFRGWFSILLDVKASPESRTRSGHKYWMWCLQPLHSEFWASSQLVDGKILFWFYSVILLTTLWDIKNKKHVNQDNKSITKEKAKEKQNISMCEFLL